MRATLETLPDIDAHVIYVNDGSTDGSLGLMLDQRKRDHRFSVIDLSRNFGQQSAIAAGLTAAGGADALTVHVARRAGEAVAAMITLRFARTLVYKYGGSDARHHPVGSMPFLFWRVIEQAHRDGLETLDLGRSNFDQPGLIAFKEHLGATRTTLTYHRLPAFALC